LRRVEPELFAGTTNDAWVEGLVRASERDLRLSAISVHGHHDMPLVTLLMLTMINAAPLFD
jgi:hypothetical protein